MKRRTLRIANFIAFNLLFFALYLNFIHKDKSATGTIQTIQQPAAFAGTTLVQNPEKYLGKKEAVNAPSIQISADKSVSAN